MIALAIIGVTAVVLLEQRLEVVRDAARARDLRTAWVLASQKLAELELDPTLWTGTSTQLNGDFSDVDPGYAAFYWEYQIVREQIDINDPNDPKSDKKPRDLLRLTMSVKTPAVEDPLVLEAQFPIHDPRQEPKPPAEEEKTPPPGTQPPPGAPKK